MGSTGLKSSLMKKTVFVHWIAAFRRSKPAVKRHSLRDHSDGRG
jgi:hypothetical protein